MINTLSFVLLENIVNKTLRLNPESMSSLLSFEGEVLAFYIKPLTSSIFVQIRNDGILLSPHYQGSVTTKITSTLTALLEQLLDNQTGLNQDIKIEGNAELAQAMLAMIKSWPSNHQEILSLLLGDVVGNSFTQRVVHFFNSQKKSVHTTTIMLKEYLQEEIQSIPSREEVEDGYHDVYILQNDVERFAMRLKYCCQKLNDRLNKVKYKVPSVEISSPQA